MAYDKYWYFSFSRIVRTNRNINDIKEKPIISTFYRLFFYVINQNVLYLYIA